jgi:hypothetical protein
MGAAGILKRGFYAVVLACLMTSPLLADDETARSTLKGLRVLKVVVENLPEYAERDGLVRDTVQTDVELKLRQAGITVSSDASVRSQATVYVNVNPLKLSGPSSGLYAYSVSLELTQPVRLIRDPGVWAVASTWKARGSVGTVGGGNLSRIRDSVRDATDEFINDYLAVNPKR